MLDGSEEVSTSFSFSANHDWEIIDYKGFTCTPSSGTKCINGEIITVKATPLRSNNTADTIRLSDLNFKLLSTRFVGISAYQLPQIRFPEGNRVLLAAKGNSVETLKIVDDKAAEIGISRNELINQMILFALANMDDPSEE